jgi:hypothetical protein
LECKVLCRVGDVGDEQTQTLVITTIDGIAMSDDNARQQLDKLKEYSQTPPPPNSFNKPVGPVASSNE